MTDSSLSGISLSGGKTIWQGQKAKSCVEL